MAITGCGRMIGGDNMNHNYLSAASAAVALLIGCAVEGGGLTVGRAFIALVPIVSLLIWSFAQSDLYE